MVSLTSRSSADPALASALERLIARYLEHHEDGDTDLIRRAGLAAIAAHEGQLRRTGEPYVTHPIAVAGIVAELGLDATTIAAALLHDAVRVFADRWWWPTAPRASRGASRTRC